MTLQVYMGSLRKNYNGDGLAKWNQFRFYMLNVNTSWQKFRYSQLLFTIDEYDVTMPVPRIRVSSHIELWWQHNVKSEKTLLNDNGEM